MKKRVKRASIFMIYLLVMQSIVAGIAPIQTAYAEENKNDTFFDFESITESSFSEEDDGWFLHIDWSLADYDLEDVNQPVDFNSPAALVEQEGTLSLEGEAVDIAFFETTGDVIRVTFHEAALEHPEAEGTLKLQVPLEDEVVDGEETTEESIAGGFTEEAFSAEKETVEEESIEEESTEADLEAVKEMTEYEEQEDAGPAKEEAESEEIEIDEEEETTTATASKVQPAEAQDLGNIFTFDYFQLNGEEIEDGAIIEVGDDTKVEVAYKWETEGLDAKAGDTASIQLPGVFKQVNISNQPIIVSGETVGTYSIVDGELQFVFNEIIEDTTVHNGVIGLNLQFDLEKFRDDIEQEIKFNDKSDKTITVIVKPNGDISGITKEGHPDQNLNAREITWTVDVMNDSDEPITEAVLEDSLPEGLGEPRDFVVNDLSVGLDGSKSVGEEVNVSPEVDGNKFSIGLDSLAPYKGYRVQYTTTIDDYSIENFTNDATFSYGNTELSAETTVFAGNRSNPIEKTGNYNWDTGQIDWIININESGGEIDEAIVHDSLPEELTLVEGSIEIHKFDSNWERIEETTADAFPINLGQVASNEIYQITFSTDIDWSKVNGGNYQHYNGFTNQAEFYDGEIKVGEDEATVEHWRDTLIEKSGKSNVDYHNKTLTWTIDVNKAKHPISGNAVITDLIPAGLSISEEDISIIGKDEESFDPESIEITLITEGDNKGKTEVKIDLGNIGSEHIRITYTTDIKDFNLDSFDNVATLDGEGIGEENPKDNEIITPPANSFAKDFTGIDYTEKTIDWKLTVNPIREAVTELKIVDTFPNKGLILLPETLEVTVGGDKLKEGTDYTLVPNGEGYHEGFIIKLNESALPLNSQIEVTYQTSYDPQYVDDDGNSLEPHEGEEDQARIYKNHAQFSGTTKNGNPIDVGREAQTTVREDSWNSGKKEGQIVHVNNDRELVNGWESGSERKIAWQLYTNYQQQNLGTGVTITDTLGYEGRIDEESIIVKSYDVDAGGDTTTKDVLSTDNYSVSVEGNTFTLKFADGFEVNERYVVEFTTSVPDLSQPNYKNKATVKVGDNDYPYSGTVHYDRHDNFLQKGTVGLEGNDVFTGEEIDWEVSVNESLSTIKNAVITDTISPGLVYVEDSLEIVQLEGSEEVALTEGEDYSLDVNTDIEETVLTINLEETLENTLVLRYTTVVTEEDGEVNNTVELNGSDVENVSVESERLNAKQFSWVDGEFNPKRGAIKVIKVDSEKEETIANNEATFKLSYDLNGERVQFGEEFTTENGVLEIGNLPLRTYYLEEVESPNGYILSEEEIEIEIDKPYGNDEHVYEFDFENTKEKIDVTGMKIWEGGPKPSIELQLYRDGEAYGEPVTIENGETEYTWSELDKTDIDGKAYQYTVDEVEVPAHYEKTVSDDGLTITNEYIVEQMDISVEKTWKDANNQDGVRPEFVIVKLLANDEETGQKVTLSGANNWTASFTGLPATNDAGVEINYTVEEVEVDSYESETAGDADTGFEITNTHEPELIDLEGTKRWDDADNQDGKRPESITVRLLANGDEVDNVEVSEESDWSYTFTDLPKFKNGEEMNYTIQELAVEDYTTVIDEMNITNKYAPGKTYVNVVKAWKDAENQDGVRPEAITVKLLANGEETGQEEELTADNNWQVDFTDLDEYKDGELIDYTVEEAEVKGYETETTGAANTGFVITNTHEPELIDLEGTKTWDDADNQDGKRPDSITIYLLANGEEVEAVEVDEEADWNYSFTDLPKFENGEEINYTVQEDNVADYSAKIDGMDITNSYTPDQTSINVVKSWNDANNQDGTRPDSITVKLLADGEETGQELILNEENNWQGDFVELDVYADGEEIEYSIEEVKVDGYEATYNGSNITNVRVDKLDVDVTKTWQDDNPDDRPDHITVNLLQNGVVIDTKDITADMDWTYSFTDLDEFNNQGEAYEYTITEHDVPGYESQVDGFGITNTRTEEKSITVTKAWVDDNSSDRPTEITVDLLQNGEVYETVQMTETDSWTYEFENLTAYDEAGQAITYSIEEHEVDSYESTINGFDITNVLIKEETPESPEDEEGAVTDKDDDNSGQNGSVKPSVDGKGEAGGDSDGKSENPKAGEAAKTDKGDGGETLPRTATSIFNLLLISLGLIGAGAILVIVNRLRNRSSN